MRAKFVDVNGIETRVLIAGQGPPIVLLHGVGMSGDCFHRNIAALAADFQVIAPDLLGHGFTGYKGFDGLPPPLAMARHVAGLLDLLDVRECCVVGSSLGGLVAALTYFERPDAVRKLVLAASSSCFNTPEQQQSTLKASSANALTAMRDPTLDGLRTRLRNIVFDDTGVSEELLLVQLTSYASPERARAYVDTIGQTIDTIFDPAGQVSHRLDRIGIPVLMVAGRDDIRTPVDRQIAGVARFPRARLEIYERCGHFPFLEHPRKFHDDLTGFLNGQGTTRTREMDVTAISKEEIRLPELSEPLSHYTDAVKFGNLLLVSGVAPLDGAGNLVGKDDPVAQTECVLGNMKKVLDRAGADFADVLKVTVFLTDISHRTIINPVRQKYFGKARPASTLIEVSALAVPGMMVEIEAIVGLKG